MRIATFAIVLFASVGCVSSESDHAVLTAVRADVHVAAGFMRWQLPEFLRQLKISAYVDLGTAWKDYGDNGIDYGKPPVVSFDSKKGTVRELLDDYCKTRDLVWELRGKQGIINILSKKENLRRTNVFLNVQFAKPIDLSSELNETTFDSVVSAWKEVVRPGVEVQIASEDDLRKLPLSINKRSRNFTAIIDHWLESAPQVVIWLREYNQAERVSAILDVSSTPIDLESQRNEDLLKSMIDREAALRVGPNNFNKGREYCINEYYRRWITDRDATTKAYLAFGKHIAAEILKPGSNLKYEFWKANLTCYGHLQIELFKTLNNEMKMKFMDSSVLPIPSEDGAQWVDFWKSLLNSDVAEIRDSAKSILEEYDNKK